MDAPETVSAAGNTPPAAGSPPAPRKRVQRRVLALAIGCIVLLLLVGWGTWAVVQHFKKQSTLEQQSIQKSTPGEIQHQVLSTLDSKSPGEAQAYLDGQLRLASTPAEKALVYDYMVMTASTTGNTKGALQYALDGYNASPTEPRVAAVARLEMQLGDKAAALKYYKIGFSKLDSHEPYYLVKKAAYEKTISELEQ